MDFSESSDARAPLVSKTLNIGVTRSRGSSPRHEPQEKERKVKIRGSQSPIRSAADPTLV